MRTALVSVAFMLAASCMPVRAEIISVESAHQPHAHGVTMIFGSEPVCSNAPVIIRPGKKSERIHCEQPKPMASVQNNTIVNIVVLAPHQYRPYMRHGWHRK